MTVISVPRSRAKHLYYFLLIFFFCVYNPYPIDPNDAGLLTCAIANSERILFEKRSDYRSTTKITRTTWTYKNLRIYS